MGEIESRRDVNVKARIFQGESSNTRITLSPTTGTLVNIEDVEVAIPVKCELLVIQPRLCGDHYAEIKGIGFYVGGFGPGPLDAVNCALAKVQS